ncbi:MAG TPA: branched-chain amino acid ABC transporter permease [Acidimicrobiaceae bacterium]|nr:branched-chain amino acid ABC transporter permease [Acidimicrobiaceae bacterium]HCV34442.1 branched-chain amino acid ABC transporter permease [Acidimicrobiaceae bacterium]
MIGAEVSTHSLTTKSARRLAAVDRFLTFIRVFLVALIVIGLLAFIWQQIDADNPFARWRNPDARGLTGDQFKGLLISGLSQGSMYGLIALGYSMVYGVLGFINFAHGEVFMVGAMTGFIASEKFQANGMWEQNFILCLLLIILMAILFSTFTAVLMERVAYRPLRNSPRLIPLITSIGVSFFIQNFVLGLFGPASKSYPRLPEWLSKQRSILTFEIAGTRLLVLVVAAVSMVVLWYVVERTKTGKAMRAVAEDKEIAALMGIDVNRTIVTTFAVGGAMAGVGGILWGLMFRSVTHMTGFLPGVKAFTAAVVGGIGNLGGAMAGGISLGSAESIAPMVILEPLGVPGVSQLKDAVAFTVLVLVLLFKPSGLFGERLSAEDRA